MGYYKEETGNFIYKLYKLLLGDPILSINWIIKKLI